MLTVAVPTDDGSIQAALADLDVKLSAWTSAMLSAQEALVGACTRQEQQPAAVEQSVPAPDAAAPEATTETTEDARIASGETPPASPALAVAKPIELTVAPAVETTVFEPEPAQASSAHDPEPVPSSAQTRQQEDDALLATLDEETAKAIRIMRRLDPGRRTVAELLNEYQAGRASHNTQAPKAKSWWSRGKG